MAAMQPAVNGKLPVAFEAQDAREIRRALAMAKDLKLDPITTGALEAADTTADLKATERARHRQHGLPGGDRRRSRRTPTSRLRGAAVRVRTRRKPRWRLKLSASCSRLNRTALKEPRDFVKNVGRAVKAGLSKRCCRPRPHHQCGEDRRRGRSPWLDRKRKNRERDCDRR